MQRACEACEITPSDSVESCDDETSPYYLCSGCQGRLYARALRPIEWYNLAKRHGWWQFLLHDDFYDEDGTATQPEYDFESPPHLFAPTLESVQHDLNLLLDFTITKWHFDEIIENAWRNKSPIDVLKLITLRFAGTRNAGIKSTLLDVVTTLGTHGCQFVQYAWGDYPETVDLASIAKASASCLTHREGFDRVVGALRAQEEREKRDLMYSLSYFHSPESLDWIEENIGSSVTESWGRLAAASMFDWTRATKWLGLGRPLSLVALDALASIIRPQTPILKTCSPRLQNPPDLDTLSNTLLSHADRDSVPRVTKLTQSILENAIVLTTGA